MGQAAGTERSETHEPGLSVPFGHDQIGGFRSQDLCNWMQLEYHDSTDQLTIVFFP